MRRISASIFEATSPSRYSSRYFIAVSPSRSWNHGRFVGVVELLQNRRIEFAEVIEVAERLVGALGFSFIDAADSEADMHQDILAGLRLRHILQAGVAGDAAELHLGHAQSILLVGA